MKDMLMQKIIIVSTLLFIIPSYGMLKITSSRIKHSAEKKQSRRFMPFDGDINLQAFNKIAQLKARIQHLEEEIIAKDLLLSENKIESQTVTEEMILFRSRDQHRTNEE